MIRNKMGWRWILLLGWLVGCAGPSAPTALPATPSAPAPAISASPSVTQPADTPTPPTPSPANTPLANTRYEMTVELDYDAHSVDVQQHIQYVNHSPDALSEVRLVVPPNQYRDVFTLDAITWDDGQAIAGAGWQDNQALVVALPQALPAGGSIGFTVRYRLALPSAAALAGERPVPFGYKERQTNLVDWYPFAAPYRGAQGWLIHPPGYYGEHLVSERADFVIDLRVRSARPLIVAASSPPVGADPAEKVAVDQTLRYQLTHARSFAFSFSPDYVVTREPVASLDVLSYAFPLHAAAGEAAGVTTAQAIDGYTQHFGALGRSQISVVEADFLDGMEFDGLYFLSDGFYNLYQGQPNEYLVAIAAHETAHQWWYASVGNDQALEPWLDEALCTYSERIYYEQFHPEALDWWWAARIQYFQPGGWVDSSIYDHVGQANAYAQYRSAVYLNGAVFLGDLRQAMGDAAFFAFLKDYAQSSAGKLATRADFFAAVQRHTSTDLSTLIQTYFKAP